MKFTIEVDSNDICAITHAEDGSGRAVISFWDDSCITVEELADDVIERLMEEENEQN